MPTELKSFFGTRKLGKIISESFSAWRYGTGNSFIPALPIDRQNETENAQANISHIVSVQLGNDLVHPGVIIRSQYGNKITVVDQNLLDTTEEDPEGRIVLDVDGLFSLMENVPLLSRSGDAHTITFKSDKAVAILIGSWRCIADEIFGNMIGVFKEHGILPEEIEVSVGPGLGPNCYSLGKDVYDKICAVYPNAAEAFDSKPRKSKPSETKYMLDFPKLIEIVATEYFGVTKIDLSQALSNFDKTAWKEEKRKLQKPEDLLGFYAEQLHFSARLYSRVCREVLRKNPEFQSEGFINPNVYKGTGVSPYDGTGRNLNGVMRCKR